MKIHFERYKFTLKNSLPKISEVTKLPSVKLQHHPETVRALFPGRPDKGWGTTAPIRVLIMCQTSETMWPEALCFEESRAMERMAS